MRRGLGVVMATLSVAAFTLTVTVAVAPVAHGDDPPPTTAASTTPLVGEASSLDGASRGAVAQLTPTLPPPPTEPPYVAPLRSPDVAPLDSDWGRRVVYSKGSMRVWMVDGANNVERSYLVSGRFSQPNYGVYSVYSRSTFTCNIDHPNVCMRWMVRFTQGPNGDNIGFHEIPRKDGWPLQTEAQLGIALSSGCVRQSTLDAMLMWVFAPNGTKVVVIP